MCAGGGQLQSGSGSEVTEIGRVFRTDRASGRGKVDGETFST